MTILKENLYDDDFAKLHQNEREVSQKIREEALRKVAEKGPSEGTAEERSEMICTLSKKCLLNKLLLL